MYKRIRTYICITFTDMVNINYVIYMTLHNTYTFRLHITIADYTMYIIMNECLYPLLFLYVGKHEQSHYIVIRLLFLGRCCCKAFKLFNCICGSIIP